MFKPIHFEKDNFTIHSFRGEDLERFEQLSGDIFAILSDEYTLKYLPAKRLQSKPEAALLLRIMIINHHTGRSYMHFITEQATKKVVGMIDLITPQLAREYYTNAPQCFFIEFYLGSFASGAKLMTEILPTVTQQLLSQGIQRIGAVVNPENIAARKVLEKAKFVRRHKFDRVQDFYEIKAARHQAASGPSPSQQYLFCQ